jgi:hypothetical protein
MNPRTKPAQSAALYPVAPDEGETRITGLPGDLHDICTLGFGQAIEFERAWFASIASLNSCAIGVSKSALRMPLPLDIFFHTMTGVFAPCIAFHQSWLNLMVPRAGSKTASVAGRQDPPEPEEEKAALAEDLVVETFENY